MLKKVSDVKIRLIATDLDGTLIGGIGELLLYDDFRNRLKTLRSRYGAVWVVCTGRSRRSFNHLFSPMKLMGFAPEYVIVNHAYIYRRTRSGRYRPHYGWNILIHYNIWASRLYMKDAIEHWYKMVMNMVEGVTTVYHRRNRLCLRFDAEEDAAAVAKLLKEKAKEFKYLRVFQFAQEVDVRMVPFTKGLALEELANRLGINSPDILAIGNGHNDISMLDGEVAGLTGCPSNAEIDVMATVHRSGGHISHKKVLEGVIDVIDAFLEERVDCKLPEWWVSNKQQKNPKSANRYMNHPPKKPRRNRKKIIAAVIIIMIVYSVLLVFSSFGVIPFSNIIQKPLMLVMELVLKISDLF